MATGRIFNIGNPANHVSVRRLAEIMLAMALEYPEYSESATNCRIIETSSADFYGSGYQDVQDRVPMITDTIKRLGWHPTISMEASLRRIFEAYRSRVGDARLLVEHIC